MKIKSCDLCMHLWASVNSCINIVVWLLITPRVVQMERSEWMKAQRSSNFISGMTEFINLAESRKKRIGNEGYILCPCSCCANTESHEVSVVEFHLVMKVRYID